VVRSTPYHFPSFSTSLPLGFLYSRDGTELRKTRLAPLPSSPPAVIGTRALPRSLALTSSQKVDTFVWIPRILSGRYRRTSARLQAHGSIKMAGFPVIGDSAEKAAGHRPVRPPIPSRRQSQHSEFAKTLLMNKTAQSEKERNLAAATADLQDCRLTNQQLSVQPVSPTSSATSSIGLGIVPEQKLDTLAKSIHLKRLSKDGVGPALTDTPLPSAPTSPRM
jgi:hypothetical protein